MTVIQRPDNQAEALTLEDFFRNLAENPSPATRPRTPQEAVARILELQKHVKPDPENWTIHDYIDSGRP